MSAGSAEKRALQSPVPPPEKRRTVKREDVRIPRIQALIEHGTRKPLLMAMSARGSGKSTQMALFAHDWTQRRNNVSAWCSMTSADDTLSAFWGKIAAALEEGLQAGCGDADQGCLGTGSEDAGTAKWLDRLVRTLGASGASILLTINDLEQVENASVLQSLERFAATIPSNVHVAVLTRVRRIPLSRLRLDGKVAELSVDDFSLTEREIRLIALKRGIVLSDREARNIRTLTRGWAAGVHMILLRRGRGGNGGDTRSACGNDQWFIDYLNEEVLPELSDDAYRAAMRICSVNGFTYAMLEEAFGCRRGACALAELRAANLAVPLSAAPLEGGPAEGWFECHPLFVEPLRLTMRMECSLQTIGETANAAVDWYEELGYFGFAIETALAQGSYDRVFDLVTKHLYPILATADSATFSQWFEGLEHPHGEKEYLFFLVNAWASFISGKAKRAHMWLSRIDVGALQDEEGALRGTTSVYRAVKVGTLVFTGEYKEALKLGSASLGSLGGPQLFLRCTIMHNMGEALERLGRYHEAYEYFTRAKVNAEISGRRVVELLCANEIAWIRFAQGRLDSSTNVAMRMLSLCSEEELEDSWAVGLLYVSLSRAYLQWGNDAKAASNLDRGLKLLGPRSNMDGYLEAQVMLSQLHLFNGRIDEALDVLLEAYETLQIDSAPRGVNLLLLTMFASSLMEAQRYDKAEEMLEEAQIQTTPEDSYYQMRQSLVRAQLAWVRGDTAAAFALLDDAARTAKEAGLELLDVDRLHLKACILFDKGEKAESLEVMAEALDKASSESCTLPFMRNLPHTDVLLFEIAFPVNDNLVMADRRKDARDFARTVLERKGLRKEDARSADDSDTVSVAALLSEREIEVHALLKQGKTRNQIASELGIQLNTVRTHIRNIYRKLGVRGRSAL